MRAVSYESLPQQVMRQEASILPQLLSFLVEIVSFLECFCEFFSKVVIWVLLSGRISSPYNKRGRT